MIAKVSGFIGACVLTGALLLPHAPVLDVVLGMGVAGLLLTLRMQK